jgi:hypothetical protein
MKYSASILFFSFLERYVQTVHIHLADRSIVLLVIRVFLVRRELKVHRNAYKATTVKKTNQYVVLVKRAISALIQQVCSNALEDAFWWKMEIVGEVEKNLGEVQQSGSRPRTNDVTY